MYNAERNNCTVVALSAVTDLPYNECKNIAMEAGRVDGRGFRSATLIKFFNKNIAEKFDEVYMPRRLTVSTFCKEHPKGRFYVRKRGHAFSIINGVVHDLVDASTPRSFIQGAWKFE